MTLNLTKEETHDVSLAITAVICGLRRGINDEDKADKEFLLRSIEQWESLRKKIKEQVKEQDAE